MKTFFSYCLYDTPNSISKLVLFLFLLFTLVWKFRFGMVYIIRIRSQTIALLLCFHLLAYTHPFIGNQQLGMSVIYLRDSFKRADSKYS